MNIFLLKYFALFGAIFGLVKTFLTYKKIKSIYFYDNETLEDNEVKNFIKWYGICFTVPFLLLQIFQIMGNYNTVFYIFLLDFTNPFYILGFSSMILSWGLLLYLIIIKDGAEIIAKYNEAFRSMPAEKNRIKIFFAAVILVALTALLFGNKLSGGAISGIEAVLVE